MSTETRSALRKIIRKIGFDVTRRDNPVHSFHTDEYIRHNARRLEHLASMRIPVSGKSVLEVGAGIGDHSNYYIDRGCRITITEARAKNLKYLRNRYSKYAVQFLDMENPSYIQGAPFDVVHCYGLLYHLSKPEQALAFLRQNTNQMLLLETRVSFGESDEMNLAAEKQTNPVEAYSGIGCRPTRAWLFKELKRLFEYVYLPITQPNHEEFPLDWTAPEKHKANVQRAIFVASLEPLQNERLTPSLILKQTRHE